MFILRFLDDLFYVLNEMMNPSTQVLGREDQIDIRCPVPLEAFGATQSSVFAVWLKYIFCQDVVPAISLILDNEFKKISASFLWVFFLLDALNGLEFIFATKEIGGLEIILILSRNITGIIKIITGGGFPNKSDGTICRAF